MNIHLSMGNTKMGPVPSFSLPPIETCNNCMGCSKKGCYAKMLYARKSVKVAWSDNLSAAKNNPENLATRVNGWLAMYQPKAFRLHVGGDFFNGEYFRLWCSIAKSNPKVKFFAFTKQYDVLRENMKSIPKNLSIILSAWLPSTHNWYPPEDLMKKFPVAWVAKDYRGCHTIESVREVIGGRGPLSKCEGQCAECGKCFARKRKDGDVIFWYH